MMGQNNNAIMDDAATEAVGATAGDLLQRARESAGLTREAVAKQLNLLPAQVIALEENDFKRFPGETFVKGHQRSYARLLGLDPEAVLRAGNRGAVGKPSAANRQSEFTWRPVSLNPQSNHWRRYSGLAAAFAVFVALWAWQQHRDHSQVVVDRRNQRQRRRWIDTALNSDAESALMDSVQLLPSAPAQAAAARNLVRSRQQFCCAEYRAESGCSERCRQAEPAFLGRLLD